MANKKSKKRAMRSRRSGVRKAELVKRNQKLLKNFLKGKSNLIIS